VEEDSASPNLPDVERAGIQADHSHLCKFDSDTSPGFDLVVEAIGRYAEEAPPVIERRWRSEHEARDTLHRKKAEELYPAGLQPPNPGSYGPPTPENGSRPHSTGKQALLPAPPTKWAPAEWEITSQVSDQPEIEEPEKEYVVKENRR
jgi:hypothetical protein